MSNDTNPYILFLILILLIVGSDPEATQKFATLKSIVDRLSAGINNVKTGMHTLASDFGEIHFMLQGLNKPSGQNE